MDKKIAGFSSRLGCDSTPSRAIVPPLHYRTNAGKPMQRYKKIKTKKNGKYLEEKWLKKAKIRKGQTFASLVPPGCGSTPSRAITTPLHYRTNAGKPMQRYIKF